MMSIFVERLTTCAHDAAAIREHRNRVAGRFRIALASAKSKQLLESVALRGCAEACTLGSEAKSRLLATPLFEWATSLLSSAVATDASLAGEFVLALQGAMRQARHSRDCAVPIDRVELLAFEAILGRIIGRQEIGSRHLPASIVRTVDAGSIIEDSVNIISTSIPANFIELGHYANTIVPFWHPDISGTSIEGANGLIFVRLEDEQIDTIDHIVHEWAHNKFELILNDYNLWLDDNELHYSPIRSEPRHLYGVFHANYVLLVVSQALRFLAKQHPQFHARADLKATGFLDECIISLNSLKAAHTLTDLGRQFIAIGLQWADSIYNYESVRR
jgi:hypothetical protein